MRFARGPKLGPKPHGQAIVEFLVAGMFVLVPLFLAISALGKFSNVQHTAEAAARYAAWERTVWYESSPGSSGFDGNNQPNSKSAAEIRNEIAVRVLNDRSSDESVIKHGDKTANGFANGLDPMFTDPGGTAFLTEYGQLASDQTMNKPDMDIAGAALEAMAKVPMFKELLPALPTDSLATTTVKFKTLGKTSEVYARLWPDPVWAGLDFQATSSILSNTWAANSRSGAESMVSDFVPARKYAALNKLLVDLQGVMGTWDPTAASGIEVGRIAVDEVPPDRLK